MVGLAPPLRLCAAVEEFHPDYERSYALDAAFCCCSRALSRRGLHRAADPRAPRSRNVSWRGVGGRAEGARRPMMMDHR